MRLLLKANARASPLPLRGEGVACTSTARFEQSPACMQGAVQGWCKAARLVRMVDPKGNSASAWRWVNG
jgi:hypothetical protein